MADMQFYFRELVEGTRTGTKDRLLLALLRLSAYPYGLYMRVRAWMFASGLFPSRRLSKPVISVGNLTVGGTGKTPTTAFLARFFTERGKRVAVLSRGYGGSLHGQTKIVSDGERILLTSAEAGDEPYMLAATVPGLMVVIGPDRYQAGLLAEKELRPDLFLLDDGFQHLRLKRDLDILLLDCARPYGNGRLLPAGFLREPPSAVRRADLIIFTRCQGDASGLPMPVAVCRSSHRLTGLVPLGGDDLHPFGVLKEARVMAFAGIADGGSFFDGIEAAGIRLIATLAFPDHAVYAEDEIAAIIRLRDASRSNYLLTTEKDAVKLLPVKEKLGNVFAVRLGIDFEDEIPLRNLLEKFL